MVAQRGSGVSKRVAVQKPAPPDRSSASASERTAKRKLSFKEKHALETLPARLDALSVEADSINDLLADATLFSRDPQRFEGATTRLAAIDRERSALEDEWLKLEMLREELEG